MTEFRPLPAIIGEWLREYQLDIIRDSSRYRIVLKGRQIGISDGVIALELVLLASGLVDVLPDFDVNANNCVVISRRDTEGKDLITKAKEWIRRLRLIKEFRPWLDTTTWSASEIKFVRSSFRIVSETQNPDAARGKTGHLYMDEYAFYQFQREIFRAAAASTESRPDLRITLVSTPNGMGDHFHEVWTDQQFYGDWGRHKIDIHTAVAQGMPVDVDSIRAKYTADAFAQEFECSFLGGDVSYFDAALWAESVATRSGQFDKIILGIDAASLVDNTSVQVMGVQGQTTWLGDNYTISKLPYKGHGNRLGQVDIVMALITVLQPAAVVVDRTGDAANAWTRGEGLFDLLAAKLRGSGMPCIGVTITRGWKNTWVQKLKVAMQTRKVLVDGGRKDLIFSNRGIALPAHDHNRIVGSAFEESPFPILRADFLKVHRKWTGTNQTTFDTSRDSSGHGDSFWSTVLGFSFDLSRSQPSGENAKLRRAAYGGGGPSSSYGDYI